MRIIQNGKYLEIISRLCAGFPHWDKLNGKVILISGATGMIGSLLVDTVMLRNRELSAGERCSVIAIGRNRITAEERFGLWFDAGEFQFIEQNISEEIRGDIGTPDYIIHAASTTHPRAYSTEPVNTILANVLGTRNLLDLAVRKKGSRFLLLSSVEIYGENRGDVEYFKENYCGYIDCNTLRAGYPEGKRVSEAMCQAYIQERGADAVVIRLPRTYGPTMRMTDSKAIAQFIQKGIIGEDIVLKSEGNQLYSYLHAADAVQAMLWVLLCGKTGEAYNAGDQASDITLRDLAEIVAKHVGTNVVFDLPDETERRGYSVATKALLDASKLKDLGWAAEYDIQSGICETVDILQATK